MKRYEVMISIPCYAYVTVDADSPEQAKRIALEETPYEACYDSPEVTEITLIEGSEHV